MSTQWPNGTASSTADTIFASSKLTSRTPPTVLQLDRDFLSATQHLCWCQGAPGIQPRAEIPSLAGMFHLGFALWLLEHWSEIHGVRDGIII